MEHHWQAHKERLYRYIAHQVEDQHIVEDLLQEVFIKAHTHFGSLKSTESLGSWLYRIAYNVIMDYYRSKRPWDELPESLESPEEDEYELTHQEVATCLVPLMNELPEKYRLPLQMAELEGMTQQQVADQLGLSLSGAKSRIQRGRVLLRERFTTYCDIEVGRGGVIGYSRKDLGCNTCE